MGLPNSQRHILVATANELQADHDLAAAFSAFTSVTRGAAMPAVEQLPPRRWRASWRSLRRVGSPAFTHRQFVLLVATMAALAAGLTTALDLGHRRGRRGPAGLPGRGRAAPGPLEVHGDRLLRVVPGKP